MDLGWLAGTGASAIVSAMATPAWEWTRSRLARLFSPNDLGREEAEGSRLSGFASELKTTSERDVQNRLCGFLEARLGDDPDLMNEFAILVKEICVKIDLQPPTEWTSYVNAPGSVVVMAGQNADVHVSQGHHREVRITWAAMTTQEAARKLETLDRFTAATELASMDPASAARRLAHVDKARAADLLSHMDEPLAADLLTRISAPHTAELLTLMEPPQGAAVLENMDPDWVVARLSEMEPDRALVLFSALGSKRIDDLLAAMERQQAVRLLGSVGKVLLHQARLRTTVDMAEQEAKRIVAQAQAQAEEILDKAQRQANELKATAERTAAEARPEDSVEPVLVDQQALMMARIYQILAEQPDKLFSARAVASKAGVPLTLAKSLLTRLDNAGKIAHNHRAHLYSARPGTCADPGG
jgi:flagellar motility protein MotE (MotC chaperone)